MPLSDESILKSSLKDPEEFGLLVERHQRRVYGLLFRLAGPRDLDEMFQQTWALAFEGRKGFRGEAKFSTWLCGIAVNVVRGRKREWVKQGRHDEFDADRHGQSGIFNIDFFGAARRLDVERALGRLEAPLREALVLRYLEGMELKEAAKLLGMRENSLRVRIHRALKKIKAYVEKEG